MEEKSKEKEERDTKKGVRDDIHAFYLIMEVAHIKVPGLIFIVDLPINHEENKCLVLDLKV